MHSVFKSRNKSKKPSGPTAPASLLAANSNFLSVSAPNSQQLQSKALTGSKSLPSLPAQPNRPLRIDEFGRPLLHPLPAFTLSTQRYQTLAPRISAPTQTDSFSNPRHSHEKELQLMFGYTGLYTEIELDLATTTQTVADLVGHIKARGLETPLLFSSKALDISVDGTHSLIRSFVNDQIEHQSDLHISSPHNLAAFLKWCLARHVNFCGTRGFLLWDQYTNWRAAEKATNYPKRFITTDLLSKLPNPITSKLLTSLLDLFATVSAYSHLNGMTVHQCAAIFGGFIFGLEVDMPFEKTYSSWLSYAHATEHLILAYLRDLKETSTTGQLPSRMETSILGYPNVIPPLTRTHPSAKMIKVARFKRLTRFYNKNLIMNAAYWEIEMSETWDRVLLQSTHPPHGSSKPPLKPSFSSFYRHLLNIDHELDETEVEEDLRHLDLDMSGQQRFKSLVEKEWSGFIQKGFQVPDTKKLEFDLTESERTRRKQKHDTMDWDAFTGRGFLGRETIVPDDLEFNTDFSKTVSVWPEEKKVLSKKLMKTNKSLPTFAYDIRPSEQPPIYIDEQFFEAWADILIGSGWSRDEFKEVSWALVNYRAKPLSSSDPQLGNSLRHDSGVTDMWILFEEVVPPEYREELIENGQKASNTLGKRHLRISFLKAMTRRDPKKNSSSSGAAARPTIRHIQGNTLACGVSPQLSVHSGLIDVSPPHAMIRSIPTREALSSTSIYPLASSSSAHSSLLPAHGHDFEPFRIPHEERAPPLPLGLLSEPKMKAPQRDDPKFNVTTKSGRNPQPMTKTGAACQNFEHEVRVVEGVKGAIDPRNRKPDEPWLNVLVGSFPDSEMQSLSEVDSNMSSRQGAFRRGRPSSVNSVDSSIGFPESTQNLDRPMNPSPPSSSRAHTPCIETRGKNRVSPSFSSSSSQRSYSYSSPKGNPKSADTSPSPSICEEDYAPLPSLKAKEVNPPGIHQVLSADCRQRLGIRVGQRKESLSNLENNEISKSTTLTVQKIELRKAVLLDSPSSFVKGTASHREQELNHIKLRSGDRSPSGSEKEKEVRKAVNGVEIKPFDPKALKVSKIVDMFENS